MEVKVFFRIRFAGLDLEKIVRIFNGQVQTAELVQALAHKRPKLQSITMSTIELDSKSNSKFTTHS